MPHPLLRSRAHKLITSSKVRVPLLVTLLGIASSLTIGIYIHLREIDSRTRSLETSSHVYSKQLELNLLNSTLRIQSLLDAFEIGKEGTHLMVHEPAIKESLKHMIFQQLTWLDLTSSLTQGKPAQLLKVIHTLRAEDEVDPLLTSSQLSSPSLEGKVVAMTRNGDANALAISSTDDNHLLHLIWRVSSHPRGYLLFSTPLRDLFTKIQLRGPIWALIKDDMSNQKVLVELGENGEIRVLVDQKIVDSRLGSTPGIQLAGNSIELMSLNVSWIGHPDRSVSVLTWVVWVTGVTISVLFSLLLAFVIDQNRKISDLVIRRTVDLESALSEATEANLAKSRFLANVSHELRTPLNIILGMLELVAERVRDPKTLEFLKTIQVSGDHLLNLISDLLGVASREHPHNESSIKSVSMRLPSFFEEIIRLIDQDCQKKKINLKFQVSTDIPAFVRGDPVRVRQILINLLRNAIKYTPKGWVELKVSILKFNPEAKQVTLRMSIKDTGVGIPKLKKQQIFDRFLQLESSKVLSQGGVGLGLAIVKDLTTMLNGNVYVDSEEGSGSTFTVDLSFDVVDDRSWLDTMISAQKSLLNVAVVSNDDELISSLHGYLASPQINITHISPKTLKGGDLRSSWKEFSHVLIDEVTQDSLKSMLNEVPKLKIILLRPGGNEFGNSDVAGISILDPHPLLPTELWRTLGVRPTELKSRPDLSAPTSHSHAEMAARNLTVLIVDDDKGNQHLFEAYLSALGWKLHFTENGQEALRQFSRLKPDVIIADLRMPIMDGFEMADQVRALEESRQLKSTPIILVTADALDETAEESKKHGVTMFLTKPIRKVHILEAIRKVTDP